MTDIFILTITLFVIFVAGIFVGRELTYLADKRKRKAEVHHKHPPVAAGRLDDKSKHWPRDFAPTRDDDKGRIFKHPETGLWHHTTEDEMGSLTGWADPEDARRAHKAYVTLFDLNESGTNHFSAS